MDNHKILIQSEGRAAFDLAFQLSLTGKYGVKKITHYLDDPEKGLILFYIESNNAIKLPVPLDWKGAADLAWAWLQNQDESVYDDLLDHDGSNGHGFRIYNDAWGRVGEYWHSVIAVIPIWAWYGK